MTRTEFFEWMATCDTHKWEVQFDDGGHVHVAFKVDDETDETEMETTSWN